MPPKGTTAPFGDLEMQILNILWERGPSTVRQVLEALPERGRPAYTTVLTVMRLMHEKGYLDRRVPGRAHVYQARLREARVKRGLVRDLVQRAFRGSAEALMMRLVEDADLTAEELSRVRRLIDEKQPGGE